VCPLYSVHSVITLTLFLFPFLSCHASDPRSIVTDDTHAAHSSHDLVEVAVDGVATRTQELCKSWRDGSKVTGEQRGGRARGTRTSTPPDTVNIPKSIAGYT